MTLKTHSDRLVKLFKLMMSSSLAGEVVNARDMIVKVLASEKKDIHDLANVLVSGLDPKVVVFRDRPPSAERPAQEIAAWCLEQYEERPWCYPGRPRT